MLVLKTKVYYYTVGSNPTLHVMLKKKNFTYLFVKKYEIDLWGSLIFRKKDSRIFSEVFTLICEKHRYYFWFLRIYFRNLYRKGAFKYSIGLRFKNQKKNFVKYYLWRLRMILILRKYYNNNLDNKKFKKYINKAKNQNKTFMIKLLLQLENRLDVLIYRLNITKNIDEAKKILKKGYILVNNKKILNISKNIYLNDVISFKKKNLFYKIWKKKLINKKIIFNYPSHIEMNYELMKCLIIGLPKKKEIPYTFNAQIDFLRNFS